MPETAGIQCKWTVFVLKFEICFVEPAITQPIKVQKITFRQHLLVAERQ